MKSQNHVRFLVICLALSGLFQLTAQAGEVTKDQALTIAGKIVKNYFPAGSQLSPVPVTINTVLKTNEPFYVCNVGTSGFVLVAKNDYCPPVLGFSWESSFPERAGDTPGLMGTLLQQIRNLCEDYASRDAVNPAILESWRSFSATKSGATLKSGVIAPLLATSWNCDTTFFDLFPKSYKAGGSVPIAMGQVFRYYAEPENGTDELCYILNGYGKLCAKFSQARLNFNRMSNTLGNPAVDSLIFYMAVTCQMQPEGAALEAYRTTLPQYFGYSTNMKSIESWNYNIGEVIRHQLSLRRPVPADWIGQAFVIDGYFPDNLFHFNMGWGGQFNGFYLLDYPVVKVDTDHSLLTCYTDYHPKSMMPGATNLTAVPEGDSIRISWDANMGDSLRAMLVRFVVLRDGLIPVAETIQSSVVVSPEKMGGSSSLRVVADFGQYGASEPSVPFLYISDLTVADIPSLPLRQLINTQIGASDLLRQPFVGELELIKDLEIDFPDQRGIEKLHKLRNLRINGTEIRVLRDGDYLPKLQHLRFFNCTDFDYTVFGKTRSVIQLYGYDFLPFDLYEFRHNTDLGLLQFTTTGTNPNMLMDLYGADKYFPKLADFFLRHLAAGPGANFEDCFVSYESYMDFYPKIKSNLSLLSHTKPSVFAPCYPVPARNANLPAVTRLSWQCNNNNEAGVYYNVYVGESRGTLENVSVFQMEKYFDQTFEANKDYYWRVEAFHTDSTYYSGIYHFSTWQDLPIPFIERFDEYFSSCIVADESPFWINFDNALTGKAVTNRNTTYEGNYSLEIKPKSDAGVLIRQPVDPVYYIEFRFLNQRGQIAVELLQKSSSSDENIVNSKIEFLGNDIGLFTYEGSTFPFSFVADQWNRINISLNMTTGAAAFTLNELVLKEWQWHVQIGGQENTNPFKGMRFVNNAGTDGGSGFVDNLVIGLENLLSSNPVSMTEIGITYLPQNREVVITGVEPSEIRDITLYDMQGRKLITRVNPDNLIFAIGSYIPDGICLVVVNPRSGRPCSTKIAVLK